MTDMTAGQVLHASAAALAAKDAEIARLQDIVEKMRGERDLRYQNQSDAEDEVDRLRAEIVAAPHTVEGGAEEGCAIHPHDLRAANNLTELRYNGRLGICDCWKREALKDG